MPRSVGVVFGLSILFTKKTSCAIPRKRTTMTMTYSFVTCAEADWLELIKVQVGGRTNQPSVELVLRPDFLSFYFRCKNQNSLISSRDRFYAIVLKLSDMMDNDIDSKRV